MLDKVIDILSKYNLSIEYDDSKIGKCMGIGDLLFNKLVRQNKLVSEILYINVLHFTDQSWYPDPLNALEFRIKLLIELFPNFSNVKFILSNNRHICQDIPYQSLDNFKLVLNPYFFNGYISKNYSNYIIFHTKCRFTSNFDYQELKFQLKTFFAEYKSKYTIVLMGEQTFPHTMEAGIHGITTIYNELLHLSNNNEIIDLTKPEIYNELNFDNFKKDLFLIKHANYNIGVGYGGQLCSSLMFGKTIYYYPTEIFNQEALQRNNHFHFSNLTNFLNFINLI